MKYTFLWMIFLFPIAGLAQENKSQGHAWKYTGSVAGGLIIGAQEPSYMVQTIHGIKKGRWMVGIGTGLDYYIIRTVPIVAHGEYRMRNTKKVNTFLYAQAGPALAWPNNEWTEKSLNSNVYNFGMGWLAETGFGFRFPMGKKLKGFSSLGYSFKQANYEEMQRWWIRPWDSIVPIEPDGRPSYTQQKLNMFRANIRFGIEL